jgi:hypothetical protein
MACPGVCPDLGWPHAADRAAALKGLAAALKQTQVRLGVGRLVGGWFGLVGWWVADCCVASGPPPTQVAGLPTNVPFLARLAQHPALAAAARADLTTAFIPQHSHSLLAPQPLPPEVGVYGWALHAHAHVGRVGRHPGAALLAQLVACTARRCRQSGGGLAGVAVYVWHEHAERAQARPLRRGSCYVSQVPYRAACALLVFRC